MKTYLPQINWHDKNQIASCHFNPVDPLELVTCGASQSIRLWRFNPTDPGSLVTFIDEYMIQIPWINCVRFNSKGNRIGSCSDDGTICVTERVTAAVEGSSDSKWKKIKTLRGHLQPVVEFTWSSDDNTIVSGSMDHIVMIWNVEKESRIAMFSEAYGGILGICLDPLSSVLHRRGAKPTYRNRESLKLVSKVHKIPPFAVDELKPPKTFSVLFQGHDMAALNRQICFTPDGQFLVATGCSLECMGLPSGHRLSRSAAVFHRSDLSKPIAFLPVDPTESAKGVAAFPFALSYDQPDECNGFAKGLDLPYRLVVAVITGISMFLFDSHQPVPLMYMTGSHYGDLSDVQFSPDGQAIAVTSLDGFVSLVALEQNEIGERYEAATNGRPDQMDVEVE